jgi:hypothetical protein
VQEQVNPSEMELREQESDLKLSHIDFEKFVFAVKRFGFSKTYVHDRHLVEIAKELQLDF